MSQIQLRFLRRLAAACALCAMTLSQASASILYGDFSLIPPGGVEYLNVSETSVTDPVPPPRFNTPEIEVGAPNDLDFDSVNFGAFAVNSAPSGDATVVQLNLDFETLPGAGLSGLTFNEGGDYTLTGSGTSVTAVTAGIAATVTITEVNGTSVAPIQVTGSTSFSDDLSGGEELSTGWFNNLFLDFGPALLTAGFSAGDLVTAGELVVTDTLTAISESSPTTTAFITKTEFVISPSGDLVPNAIPEPTALALVGLAVAGIVGRRR